MQKLRSVDYHLQSIRNGRCKSKAKIFLRHPWFVWLSDSCNLEKLTFPTSVPSFGVFQKLACKSWEPFGHPKPRVPGVVDTFLALLGHLQMVYHIYCSISPVGKTNSIMTARFDIDHLSMLPGDWPFLKPGIFDIFHAISTWPWLKMLPVGSLCNRRCSVEDVATLFTQFFE